MMFKVIKGVLSRIDFAITLGFFLFGVLGLICIYSSNLDTVAEIVLSIITWMLIWKELQDTLMIIMNEITRQRMIQALKQRKGKEEKDQNENN